MSDSEGDFESADEDGAVAAALTAADQPPVVTSQPPTVTEADAANPAVELSYGSGGGAGGGWTSWGLSWGQSLISGAKAGVSVLAKELGDGLGTVSRTVESVLDAPPPEELAGGASGGEAAAVESEQASVEAPSDSTAGTATEATGAANAGGTSESDSGWLNSGWRVGGALKSSVTQTGSYLFSGGLDLLESLGKRTMDALQETDPGFQRTKSLLGRGRRPNLSELLREAQASGAAAASAGGPDAASADIDSPDFACQFDRLNGSAYLDGLQTLAGQCELRLQARLAARSDMRPSMADILSQLERVRGGEEDDGTAAATVPTLEEAIAGLPAQFAPANAWLTGAVADCLHCNEGAEAAAGLGVMSLQVDCVRRLAGLTAATLHYLVKAASLASASGGAVAAAAAAAAPPAESARRLAALCFALIGCADHIRERACLRMQEAAAAAAAAGGEVDEHEVNQAMTQAILEAEGAKAYLQDAFLLLAPVLQLAALDAPATASSQ